MWDIVAAAAALGAVLVGIVALVIQWYWRRPMLSVNFSGTSPVERWIAFGVQIRNDGDRTIRDVRAVALLDGERVAERYGGSVAGRTELGPSATLPPNQGAAWEVALPRPELVDLRPDGSIDLYGKRLQVRISHRDRRRHALVSLGEICELR